MGRLPRDGPRYDPSLLLDFAIARLFAVRIEDVFTPDVEPPPGAEPPPLDLTSSR